MSSDLIVAAMERASRELDRMGKEIYLAQERWYKEHSAPVKITLYVGDKQLNSLSVAIGMYSCAYENKRSEFMGCPVYRVDSADHFTVHLEV